MSHVATHCGGVGEPSDPPTIPITIHNHTRMNLAVAMFKWPHETDGHWEKRKRKLDRLVHQMYELAEMTEDDEYYYHPPSYVHQET